MNIVSRGVKNALRSPLRSGSIVLMLAISICLILSMLVARSSVDAKINEVKSTAGTNITISPAGVMGFSGGGDALTNEQLATITSTAHISSTSATLTDQLGTTDTNLTASLEMGNFGARMMRFESTSTSGSDTTTTTNTDSASAANSTTESARPAPTPRITVTGTTNPNSVSTDGSDLNITSGTTINGTSSELVALIGDSLATKNSLTIGSTFTAYDKTVTVSGIFKTNNTFQDSGIIMPLAAVQTLTDQTDAVSSVIAKVDSSDNVSSTVTALKTVLGTKADIVSQVEQAAASVSSLESISGLALAGVIGATIAGAIIILLAMILVVRERRREIGVLKAIGGSNRKVIGQFIIEALTLTIIGSIVGLTFGVLVSGPMTNSLVSSSQTSSNSTTTRSGPGGNDSAAKMIGRGFGQISNNITQVTSSITPTVFILSISITLLIAIIGSAIPAWFISRIRPAEVLRTE